jgi:hypothetical protein
VVEPRPFSREWLAHRGFSGFHPFTALPNVPVPREPGVYVVLRPCEGAPQFLERSPAGIFQDRVNTVDRSVLVERWVAGAPAVYIGKAGPSKKRSLAKRLDEYRRFGGGDDGAAHYGGRLIWQLAESPELVVGWRVERHHPACQESRLVATFREAYGAPPFANIGAPLKSCPTGECDLAVEPSVTS